MFLFHFIQSFLVLCPWIVEKVIVRTSSYRQSNFGKVNKWFEFLLNLIAELTFLKNWFCQTLFFMYPILSFLWHWVFKPLIWVCNTYFCVSILSQVSVNTITSSGLRIFELWTQIIPVIDIIFIPTNININLKLILIGTNNLLNSLNSFTLKLW